MCSWKKIQVGTLSDLGLKFLADSHIISRVQAARNVSLKGTHVNVAPSALYSKIFFTGNVHNFIKKQHPSGAVF